MAKSSGVMPKRTGRGRVREGGWGGGGHGIINTTSFVTGAKVCVPLP